MHLSARRLFLLFLLFTCSFQARLCGSPTPVPSWRGPYLGLDGGWAIGLGHARSKQNVGPEFLGSPSGARARSGYMLGASMGYKWNNCFRFDATYTFLHHHYKWHASFPATSPLVGVSSFRGSLDCHVVLVNAYLHFGKLFYFWPYLDFYLDGGIGITGNNLHHIKEHFFNGAEAEIKRHWHNNFAARLGGGVIKYLCGSWFLDLSAQAYYVGKIRTGNSQTVFNDSLPALEFSIGPYTFNRNWIGTLSAGLKYIF